MRIRDEALHVLGETGTCDFENIKDLETLENTLKETLRLRYVVAVVVSYVGQARVGALKWLNCE